MSHELENANDMIYASGVKPWHGLGIEFDSISIEEIKALPQINFKVNKSAIYDLNGAKYDGFNIITREDTNEAFATVKDGYKVIQNEQAIDFMEPFVEQKLAHIETAGSLKGGKLCWFLLKLNQDAIEPIKGHPHEAYLMVSLGHDGNHALQIMPTGVCVVCHNTFSLAETKGAKATLKILHKGNTQLALDEAQTLTMNAYRGFEVTCDQLSSLAKKPIKNLEGYVRQALGLPYIRPNHTYTQEQKAELFDLMKSTAQTVDRVMECYETEAGLVPWQAVGTMYHAYNAVTHFTAHKRGFNQEDRLKANWFGEGRTIQGKALKVAVAA